MDTEQLPMNDIERPLDAPPPAEDGGQTPTEQQQRERDESGRFAPKSPEGPRGKPDAEAARRREAQERDHWKSEAEKTKANYEALERRFTDISSLIKGEQAEDKPDPIKDLTGKVDTLVGTFQQQQQEREAEQAWTQVRGYADQDEARFTAQTPDFPDATQHYIVSRLTEMKSLGLDQATAERTLQQEAQQLLTQCAQTGRSPAETLYLMAQARGYRPGTGPAQPIRQAQPSAPAGGRSLGTGGGPGTASLSESQLRTMSDADYNALRSTTEGKRAIMRAMGAA